MENTLENIPKKVILDLEKHQMTKQDLETVHKVMKHNNQILDIQTA